MKNIGSCAGPVRCPLRHRTGYPWSPVNYSTKPLVCRRVKPYTGPVACCDHGNSIEIVRVIKIVRGRGWMWLRHKLWWASTGCHSDATPYCLGHRLFFLPWSGRGHDNVIKCKHFPRYWPFVRGIHRYPVNSLHKGQWRGALMFSLICAWMDVE